MKKCRICGALSPSEHIRCDRCDANISNLPEYISTSGQTVPEQTLIKLCPSCSGQNPEDAIRCRNCGTLLLAQRREPIPAAKSEYGRMRLTTSDGAVILIPEDGGVLGRSYLGREIFKDDPYISGSHAEIRLHNGQYALCDLHSKNGTEADGRLVPSGQLAPLKAGSIITLGHTRLTVSFTDGQRMTGGIHICRIPAIQ